MSQPVALHLRRDSYVAGVHDICLHTQLITVYIDINIVEIDEGKDM